MSKISIRGRWICTILVMCMLWTDILCLMSVNRCRICHICTTICHLLLQAQYCTVCARSAEQRETGWKDDGQYTHSHRVVSFALPHAKSPGNCRRNRTPPPPTPTPTPTPPPPSNPPSPRCRFSVFSVQGSQQHQNFLRLDRLGLEFTLQFAM
jgi:hypothetical protein